LGIKVMDSIIIGHRSFYSFREGRVGWFRSLKMRKSIRQTAKISVGCEGGVYQRGMSVLYSSIRDLP